MSSVPTTPLVRFQFFNREVQSPTVVRNGEADNSSAFSTALDVYLALYPAFAFRNLGWNRKKKMILSFIMGLGILCVQPKSHTRLSYATPNSNEYVLIRQGSASGAACYKITFLEILSRTNDFTCELAQNHS